MTDARGRRGTHGKSEDGMADVQEIRRRVERREYDVDPQRVADAILARLLELRASRPPKDAPPGA